VLFRWSVKVSDVTGFDPSDVVTTG